MAILLPLLFILFFLTLAYLYSSVLGGFYIPFHNFALHIS